VRSLRGEHAAYFGGEYEWDQASGTARLAVSWSPDGLVLASTQLEVSLEVHNGFPAQQARQVLVSFRTPDHVDATMGKVVSVAMAGSVLSFGGLTAVGPPEWPVGVDPQEQPLPQPLLDARDPAR